MRFCDLNRLENDAEKQRTTIKRLKPSNTNNNNSQHEQQQQKQQQTELLNQPELQLLLVNNNVLKEHIESLEKQLQYIKHKSTQHSDSYKQEISRLERINASLRTTITSTKEEADGFQQAYLDKDKQLQLSVVQLAAVQVWLYFVVVEVSF